MPRTNQDLSTERATVDQSNTELSRFVRKVDEVNRRLRERLDKEPVPEPKPKIVSFEDIPFIEAERARKGVQAERLRHLSKILEKYYADQFYGSTGLRRRETRDEFEKYVRLVIKDLTSWLAGNDDADQKDPERVAEEKMRIVESTTAESIRSERQTDNLLENKLAGKIRLMRFEAHLSKVKQLTACTKSKNDDTKEQLCAQAQNELQDALLAALNLNFTKLVPRCFYWEGHIAHIQAEIAQSAGDADFFKRKAARAFLFALPCIGSKSEEDEYLKDRVAEHIPAMKDVAREENRLPEEVINKLQGMIYKAGIKKYVFPEGFGQVSALGKPESSSKFPFTPTTRHNTQTPEIEFFPASGETTPEQAEFRKPQNLESHEAMAPRVESDRQEITDSGEAAGNKMHKGSSNLRKGPPVPIYIPPKNFADSPKNARTS